MMEDLIESANAPVIKTPRLRLRGHRPGDLEPSSAMWADPEVTRFIGGRVSTRQQTWQRILAYMGHWRAMAYGYWAIEDERSRRFVGEIGFADFKRDIATSMQNVPEVGFALISSVHGKGYATEALGAVLAWADTHLPSRRTVALVDQENVASIHVLEKFAYRAFERTTFGNAAVTFLERQVKGT